MDKLNEITDIGILQIGDFKLWSSMALKSFLALRGKSVNGSFDTLVAR